MFCLHVYNFLRLKFLLASVLILAQASCTGGSVDGSGDSVVAGIETINIMGLSWTVPSTREGGAPLQLSEIASFHIYYGTEAGDYQNQVDIDDPTAESAQIEALPSGTYYVVLTAIDQDGRESSYSSEVKITL